MTRYGVVGRAPKFPRPTELEFALRYTAIGGKQSIAGMALFTLDKMQQGGIYGPLLGLFADAYALTGNPRLQ